MDNCLFCKIINKEIPSEFIYEDDLCVAFNDIKPKAPTHVLLVPKKHIDSIMTLEEEDRDIVSHLVYIAKKIAEDKGLEGYQLKFHVGEKGGQEIFHLHLHLLG